MYRRLVAWSMTIASVAALAFLVPLGMNVRQYQHDIAMVRAQQEAREVSSYATFLGDANRLVAALRNLDYASTSKNRIAVWYSDGRGISATEPESGVGAMPSSVRDAFEFGAGRPREAVIDGGRELLWPAPRADGDTVVVQVVVPSSTLNENVAEKMLWLVAVGAAIVLAAGAVAGRLGRFIAPPQPARADEPQPIA